MSYLKFSADQIFTGTEFLDGQYVLITDKKGVILDVVSIEDAGGDIQHHQGILAPGFINCHCHLELSHMRGLIPEHTGLPDFILKIVGERHFPEDQILEAIAKGESEMIANGIVAVGDISNNALTLAQKQLNNLAYYTFIEVSGWKPEIASPRFENALKVLESFAGGLKSNDSRVSLSPHAPYSVSQKLWEFIMPYFHGNTVSIHNQETPAEDQLFNHGTGDFIRMYEAMNIDQSHFIPTGKSSLQSFYPKMSGARKILSVHNSLTQAADIVFANAQNIANGNEIFWCLCANANLYIENKLPPVELLHRYNCTMVIGTDSLASNHSLSMLDELKTLSENFPSIPLEELLQWATFNGAQALQLEKKFGSFGKEKQPGIILLQKTENNRITENTRVKRLL